MTDKEYAKQKRRVQRYIDKWFRTMGLGWYRIDMEWDRAQDEDDRNTAARTRSYWQYRSATITWYLPVIAELKDETLENIVVHEFTHVLLAPLLSVDKEADLPLQHEYATETVTQAIQWAREAGKKDK